MVQLSILTTITGQARQQLLEEINKIIQYDTEISFTDVPGFCLGVLDQDSTYVFSFGSAFRDSTAELADSAIFEIGGLTKIFTGLLFNYLEDLQKIDRRQKFNEFLSPNEQNLALDQITLYHLITHTSGLPSLPSNLATRESNHNNRYAQYQKSDLLSYYQGLERTTGKLGKYRYGHINYALLEIAIEKATGQSFPDLLHQFVLQPLGFKESFIAPPRPTRTLTPGHSRSGNVTDVWQFESFAGSEGMKSSPRDLVNFVQIMLRGSHVLSNAFDRSLKLHERLPGAKKTYVGDAWHAFVNRKYPNIYLHSGKTNGHAASIGFVKETKTAVILMTNATVKMDGLAMLVLRLLNDNWKRKS